MCLPARANAPLRHRLHRDQSAGPPDLGGFDGAPPGSAARWHRRWRRRPSTPAGAPMPPTLTDSQAAPRVPPAPEGAAFDHGVVMASRDLAVGWISPQLVARVGRVSRVEDMVTLDGIAG